METQKGHQALGTSFHLVLEKVPKGLPYPTREDTNASEEEWDKAKQLADIALQLLPPDPKSRIMREHGIRMPTYPGGPTMVGYIDLAIPTGVGWPALLVPPNEAIVGDYKTLSDFRYMKTPEELANSVQMMTYAKWAVSPSGLFLPPEGSQDLSPIPPETGTVRLLHLYARTKAPYSRSSIRHESAIVGTQQIEDFWGKTLDTVREMEQVAKCGSSDDVEAGGALNGHCEAYGGCHYRDKCGISKESSIKTLFNISKKPPVQEDQSNMSGSSILAKIQAARAAAQGQAPATQPVAANSSTATPPTPVGSNVSESQGSNVVVESAPGGTVVNSAVNTAVNPGNQPQGPVSKLLATIQSTGHGKPVLTGSVAQALNKELGTSLETHPGEGMRAQTTISNLGELIKYATGIVPPDAPPRTQAVITKPGDKVVDPTEEPAEAEEGEDSETVQPVASSNPVSTTASPGQEAPKRRGRPSKDEMAAREAAEKAKFDAAVQAKVAELMSGNTDAVSAVYDAQKDINALQNQLAEMQKERDSVTKTAEAYKKNLADLEESYHKLKQMQPQAQYTPAPTGPILYIDCYPIKGSKEVVDFFEWIQPITQAVAQSNGVADYRLIQYNSKGLLATHIRELVKAEGLPPAMTIPSFAAGADVALEILTPMAKQVIKKL